MPFGAWSFVYHVSEEDRAGTALHGAAAGMRGPLPQENMASGIRGALVERRGNRSNGRRAHVH